MKNETFEFTTLAAIAQTAIDKLNDGIGNNVTGADLHNELFNTDYFIIGRFQAEQWLIANTGVFNAIGIITDYEKDNFGEIMTDLSESEKVCNMIVYIAGEEVLNESKTLQKHWDEQLTERNIRHIILDLKRAYNLN